MDTHIQTLTYINGYITRKWCARYNIFCLFVEIFAELSNVDSSLKNKTEFQIFYFRLDDYRTCPSCGPNGGPGCAEPAQIHTINGVLWITFSRPFLADFNFDIFPFKISNILTFNTCDLGLFPPKRPFKSFL